MADEETKSDSLEITAGSSQALAQRSSALVTRGLRNLSGWDSLRVIEAAKELMSCQQLDQTLRILVKKVDDFLKRDEWALMLVDDDKKELYYELAVGKESKAWRDTRIKLGEGVSGYVAERAESVVVTDLSKDGRFSGRSPWEREAHSIVAVPLLVHDKCLGVLEVFDCVGPNGFPQSDLSLLESLTDFTAIALENARHVKAIHELTIIDESTGLYNARHLSFILDTEIYRSERYGYEFSLLCIDLDSLKELRKSLSYAHFIQLLNELGQVFKPQLRLIDFAFYFGDGEFIILLPQTPREGGQVMARRFHKFFRDTLWLRGENKNLYLPARIGVAEFPQDGKTKADLLHAMDEAMWVLKKTSRDGIVAANIGILSPL